MKLRKDKWEKVEITKVVDVVNGSTPKSIESAVGNGTYPFLRVSDMNLEGNETYIKYHSIALTKQDVEKYKVKLYPKGTIIFPKRGASIFTNKKRILLRESGIDLNTMGFISRKEVESYFLFTWFQTIDLGTISDGSYIPQINNRNIEGIQIFLPPLDEQKQIASLFKAIETAIEQAEGQERNLKSLQNILSNGLLSKSPVFGKLLSDKNCTLCTFGNMADCIEKHDKKPLESGITRFVGLEYIEAESFALQGFGQIEKGTTFTKRFSKGDVLFGKRRAYLKKVAIADFEGICSSDILVLRAKNTKMLPELLPYYVSSEAFIQHAVSTSAGSLSPRTKWRDLAVLEISTPDLKTQKRIVEVFQQLQQTLEQLQQQKITMKNLKQKLLSEILG